MDLDPQNYADPQIKIRKNMEIHGSGSAKICRSTDQDPQKYADSRIKIRKKMQIYGSGSKWLIFKFPNIKKKIGRYQDLDPN